MESFDYGYKFALIVEGTNDEYFLRSVFQSPFPILILHGNGLTKFQKEMIQNFLDNNIIPIIAVDPDEAGQQVANKILEDFDIPRLMFNPEECKCYRGKKIKIGLEHTSPKHVLDTIKELLSQKKQEFVNSQSNKVHKEIIAILDLLNKSLWKRGMQNDN
jgi:5S rRNA maturation endonuclease (ribonuclease M5)